MRPAVGVLTAAGSGSQEGGVASYRIRRRYIGFKRKEREKSFEVALVVLLVSVIKSEWFGHSVLVVLLLDMML